MTENISKHGMNNLYLDKYKLWVCIFYFETLAFWQSRCILTVVEHTGETDTEVADLNQMP